MNPVSRACRNALCAPIRFYQRFISPGLGRNCRFTPTCSQYGIEAIQTHGCIKGLLLTAWRIARCNPLGRWGDGLARLVSEEKATRRTCITSFL